LSGYGRKWTADLMRRQAEGPTCATSPFGSVASAMETRMALRCAAVRRGVCCAPRRRVTAVVVRAKLSAAEIYRNALVWPGTVGNREHGEQVLVEGFALFAGAPGY